MRKSKFFFQPERKGRGLSNFEVVIGEEGAGVATSDLVYNGHFL